MSDDGEDFGNFYISIDSDSLSDSGNDFLSRLDLSAIILENLGNNNQQGTTTNNNDPDLENVQQQIEDEVDQHFEPSEPKPKRFKSLDEEELSKLEDQHQATSTKRNTKWGVGIFQDWHNEVFGVPMEMSEITKEDLAERLRKFYCEAAPKDVDQRQKFLPSHHAKEYHRNTMLNIRSAINRHLKDLGRTIDIVRDVEFTKSNRTLDGFLKARTASGQSRPTKHKEVIAPEDLRKIAQYLQGYSSSPSILRECAWYVLAMHFVTRGMEFHHQLRKESIEFHTDENGEFMILNQETKEKNHQGGTSKRPVASEKRIYATDKDLCPVKIVKLFIGKQDPKAEMLFNQLNNKAFQTPSTDSRFTTKPLAKRTFEGFMKSISKEANLGQTYTAHCLRATAIQAMNDAGFEARHIMFMSGHRNEASIRSYSRGCNTNEKANMSRTLSALTQGKPVARPAADNSQQRRTLAQWQLHQNVDSHEHSIVTASAQNNTLQQSHEQQINMEFRRGAQFHNCTVNTCINKC